MGAIRVLDEIVASQIAAGEVVERPVSVVKELVENSLDAGASRIEVVIEGGGADLIRVADDGCGMDRDDAQRAFERHATSKVRGAEDLKAILSFGFRGEALPSIASVSRVTLTTSTGGPEGGTRVRVRGGSSAGLDPASHPRGTTIEVEALFYNAPARRKFLKAPATEAAHVVEFFARLAAAHPAIAFTLRSGGGDLAVWPGVASYRDRIGQILRPEQAALLVPLEARLGALRLTGLASAPSLHRSTTRDEMLFVNGRPIRDRRLLHAIALAYATLLPRGRYPVVYVFLQVPPDEVDVNVHPAKTEVRFLRPGAAHDLVHRALLEALGLARPFASLAGPPHAVSEPGLPVAFAIPPASKSLGHGSGRTGTDDVPSFLPLEAGIVPLAQFRDTYILASGPEGLVIFDQHAAHERILYERLLAHAGSGRPERQGLLFPVTFEISAREQQAYEEAAPVLDSLGFGLSVFGPGVLRVDEVPALAPSGEVERLVRDTLAEVVEWNRAEGIERLRDRMAARTACHAAVRAREPLDLPRMRQIVVDLMRSERPMTCPHGRPALLRLPLDQIEREFRRR